MRKYAKAIGGALTALTVFVAGEYGLELPEPVTGALTTLFTGAVVWALRNSNEEGK